MDEANPPATPLGHGDHWRALGLTPETGLFSLLELAIREGRLHTQYPPRRPDSDFVEVLQFEWSQPPLSFVSLSVRREGQSELCPESAFPSLAETTEWIIRVNRTHDPYGPLEGVVEGTTASGHTLQWFAPAFGAEVQHWQRGGLARVRLAALALQMARFTPEPLRISEGPIVEMHRSHLRQEGKFTEADAPDLSVEVILDDMRTLYSDHHDHHAFVGRVMKSIPIRPHGTLSGWMLELECLPLELTTGHTLPLYAFPPALPEGYTPATGDLVTGSAWLQGSWNAPASEENEALWRNAGGD